MKKTTKNSIVIGFALFSMFFGAGNLIFPPSLGNRIGDQYLIGSLGFILTGVGLPLLAIVACSKGNGTFESISNKIGVKFTIILTTILFIAIGPILAIPRTAATTYEISVMPFFPNISPYIIMMVYFIINLFFVLKRSSIIDTIGKFLTPALITILTVVIIKGFVSPIGEIVNTDATFVFSNSLLEGYQTMDALAALLFASIITASIIDKGYKEKELKFILFRASGIAAVGLTFVYGGLMYIGSQTTTFVDSTLSSTTLLVLIAYEILGSFGVILIGIAIGLACLTTSIGLITAGSSFFEKITKGKLHYNTIAIVISLISYFIACLGVDNIVVISIPILNTLYPVAITIIITTLFDKYLNNYKAIKLGVYTALIFALLFVLFGDKMNFIPLSSLGFGWIIPTILSILLGYIIFS